MTIEVYATSVSCGVMSRNVLIAPLLGFRKENDWTRLEKTIEAVDASRVHLLTLPDAQDKAPGVREYIRQELRDLQRRWPRFEWTEKRVNLFSFEDTLHEMAVLCRSEEEHDVSIALGTSGGPGAVPSTIACLLWGARGIYVGDPEYEQPTLTLPSWIRVEGPLDKDELLVLALVTESPAGLDKKTILAKLKEAGRIRPDQDKHAYRRLSSDFLPRLEGHGFVRVGPRDGWDGRHHFVQATEEGKRAHRVLSPLLSEPTQALFVRGRSGRVSARKERL